MIRGTRRAPTFQELAAGVKRLAAQDYARGDKLANRYCLMCNHGEEELADIYAAEYRRLWERRA